MFSKYNHSPSAASLRLSKSTSAQKFYRQATERSHHYESGLQSAGNGCLACRHEQQIPAKAVSNPSQTLLRHHHPPSARQDYYPQSPHHEMDNLRKSIRFLEDLLQKNKREYRNTLTRSENRIAQLMQELEEKSSLISELERKVTANQLLQQYASASLVGTYVEKDDAGEKQRLNTKIKQMGKVLERIQAENESLKSVPVVQKQQLVAIESLQQRVRECEVYAREYESMKLLIHKMEIQKEESLKKHQKAISQLVQRQREEMRLLEGRVEEVRDELNERDRQLEGKEREIERTRLATEEATHSQWEHLQDLLEQKDEEVDKLQSKLSCVESELAFLKNRFGYLLKIAKTSPQEPISTSELEDYCIERVGRHNLSNGKESLMGLNLSPIKRR